MAGISPAEALERFASDPENFQDCLNHVTMGGGLPDYCQANEIRYCDLMTWIRMDDTRQKRYHQALADRAEWSKETVFHEVKKLALDENLKPLIKLRALEIMGKTLGMFTEKHEHSGKLTLEDLIDQSMKP